MHVLIVGLGSIGRRHASNLKVLRDGVNFSLVDPKAPVDWKFSSNYKYYPTLEECLKVPAHFDFCMICSPSEFHIDHLTLLRGRTSAVFVEKPSCTNYEEASELANLADEFQTTMVGCNLRFHEGFNVLKNNLHLIGDLRMVRSFFGHWLPNWRPDQDYTQSYSAKRDTGGALLDCIHEPDLVTALVGPYRKILGLNRYQLSQLKIESEDCASLTGLHDNNVSSVCQVDYLRPIKMREITVYGSEGLIEWSSEGKKPENSTVRLQLLKAGVIEKKVLFSSQIEQNLQYVLQLNHFLCCMDQSCQSINSLATNAHMMLKILGPPEPLL